MSKLLLATLDIRPVDNVAMKGDLIEVWRGTKNIQDFLCTTNLQETRHLFHPKHRVGGNHYHHNKIEVMTVFDDPITVYLADPKTNAFCSVKVQPNYRFNLIPELAHTLFYEGDKRAEVLEHASLVFDPANSKNDLTPYKILDPDTGRLALMVR